MARCKQEEAEHRRSSDYQNIPLMLAPIGRSLMNPIVLLVLSRALFLRLFTYIRWRRVQEEACVESHLKALDVFNVLMLILIKALRVVVMRTSILVYWSQK